MAAYTKHPVGAHYGLSAWLLQRLTAVVMATYTAFILGLVIWCPPVTHADWKAMFAGNFVRPATLVFLLALLYHAWVGVRDILMDYVKPAGVRLALQALVGGTLAFYAAWSASILWGR